MGFQSFRYESRSKVYMSHFKTVKTALLLLVYVTGLDASDALQRAPDHSADFLLVICLNSLRNIPHYPLPSWPRSSILP